MVVPSLDPRERFEVVLARRPGREQDQHRRWSVVVPEAVDATLGDVQEVAGPSVLPGRPVVQPDRAARSRRTTPRCSGESAGRARPEPRACSSGRGRNGRPCSRRSPGSGRCRPPGSGPRARGPRAGRSRSRAPALRGRPAPGTTWLSPPRVARSGCAGRRCRDRSGASPRGGDPMSRPDRRHGRVPRPRCR